MTVKVHALAEPAGFETEMVVQQIGPTGAVLNERIVPMYPGRMAQEYVHSSQQIVIREKLLDATT